jgi:hypothetical protein
MGPYPTPDPRLPIPVVGSLVALENSRGLPFFHVVQELFEELAIAGDRLACQGPLKTQRAAQGLDESTDLIIVFGLHRSLDERSEQLYLLLQSSQPGSPCQVELWSLPVRLTLAALIAVELPLRLRQQPRPQWYIEPMFYIPLRGCRCLGSRSQPSRRGTKAAAAGENLAT